MSMRRSPEVRPTRWDGAVVLAVAALAILCGVLLWGGGADREETLTAVISVDGVERERIVPAEHAGETVTVESNGYTLTVRFTETTVFVEAADCPTQDCVHTRPISRRGQSIVCLPARVVIELEGGSASGDDADIVIG